uniref:Fiber protein Fb34 n=1 Tax=Oryza meridionalis TaxID=40149 RepID=A0A0E0EJN5_9ORYZ
MAGFATSRPASLALAALLAFLNLFAFLLAVGAERRRSTGKVVPDEYDLRSYCLYDTDASTVYGVSAFFVLLLAQALVTAATRCLCLGPALSSRGCAVASFVLSWITFLTAEACLIGGSVRNAYHTKYLGYYMKHDLVTCATLRKGVFAAAAALMLINLLASLMYYWSYSRAATGGFIKHQNEVGMSMTDYGLDKGGSMP